MVHECVLHFPIIITLKYGLCECKWSFRLHWITFSRVVLDYYKITVCFDL